MQRFGLLAATVLATVVSYCSPLPQQEGVRIYDLQLNGFELHGLVWSASAGRLYGISESRPDSVIRVDPETGASESFVAGPKLSAIASDSGGGVWVACNGDGTIRRINLATMAVEETLTIPGLGNFTGLTVSSGDPFSLVACRESDARFGLPRGYYVRRGVLLPDSVPLSGAVIENGTVFGIYGNVLWRLNLAQNGFVAGQLLYHHTAHGELESFEGRIYHDSGLEIDAATGAGLPGFSLPHWSPASTTINPQDGSVYLLSGYYGRLALSRFDRETRAQTGLLVFKSTEGLAGASLRAWSNLVAFAASGGKLYVVDTEKAFLPADLEVLQTVSPAKANFGELPVVSLIVTNKGPGPALNFRWNVELDRSFLVTPIPHGFSNVLNFDYFSLLTRTWETTPYPSGPANPGAILEPGRYLTVASLPLLPLRSGVLTNRIAVVTSNDPNSANNSASFAVPVAAPSSNAPVVRLEVGTTGVAADPISGRLFVNAQGKLMIMNPGEFALSPPLETGTARTMAISEGNPLALIGYPDQPGTLTLVDTRTFATGVRKARGTIYYVALSPVTGANHFAVSDTAGLSEGDFFLAGERFVSAAPGPIEYSADGQRLYHVDINTCALEIFAIARDGSGGTLTLEYTEPNLSCADFSRAGSLLYFDDGTVYDPGTRQKVGKIPGVSTPGYVAPDRSGHVNVLTRTNGAWWARRYAANNLAVPILAVEIGPLASNETPLDAVAFGNEQLAFPTTSSLFLVSLAQHAERPLVNARWSAGGNITFRFETVAGGRYLLEGSDALNPAVWTRLEQEATGTGNAVDLTIPTPGPRRFFRLLRE